MARPDARVDADISTFAREVEAALGGRLLCLVLYGSAAGDDWVAGRSDVNTALVVAHVTIEVLDALAPIVARARGRRFATPVVMDEEYLTRARDVFPMEFEDIRAQHRVLAGRNLFAGLVLDRDAIRRECEREARGKLLRLRARFLDAADHADALEQLMVESLKSFLIMLRHLLRLRGVDVGHAYPAVLAAGEQLLGPLPEMRQLLAHRAGDRALDQQTLRTHFAAYLGEVERIGGSVDTLDG